MRKLFCLLLFTTPLVAQPAPPAPPPAPPWASSIGAGLAVTSGNTDTKNINLSFTTRYDPKTRFVFKAEALVPDWGLVITVFEHVAPGCQPPCHRAVNSTHEASPRARSDPPHRSA